MGLYSGGLIHGLMFTLVTGVGLYEDGLILGWQFTTPFLDKKSCLLMKLTTLLVFNSHPLGLPHSIF